MKPFVIVQLSDPHVGAEWGGGDPVAKLRAAVAAVGALDQAPDAILVSGDLADHGADAEYELVRELLAPLAVPVHVLGGNHDDRAALRRHFDVAGAGPVQYAADLGPLRLVVVDSTRPGEDAGELDAERLAWLDASLAEAPGTPTLVAMHHPPLVTGMPAFDAVGLPPADRTALAEVVARHPQVQRIVAGHVHRTIVGALGSSDVLAVPSTYVQARLAFGAQPMSFVDEPAGFAVHALVDGAVASHIQPVG